MPRITWDDKVDQVAGPTGVVNADTMNTIKAAINALYDMLAGGTTGQVLAKSSNTDHDLEWATLAGGVTPSLTFHFGTMPSSTLPTEEEIEALTAQAIPGGGAKVIQFSYTPGVDEWLVFAYPSTETDPTTYYIGPLDNGDLGTGTFSLPATVGAYRVIMSQWQTGVPDPVTFS